MSIVDDLVENLVERNALRLNGRLVLKLLDGGVAIQGTVVSTLRDQKKNKDILNIDVPVDAEVRVADVIVPVPRIP
jgi:hypothetical protein